MPILLKMPALSPTMSEGTLVRWHVKVGDHIQTGDLLAEIETDKAIMEFEAVDAGKLAKILVPDASENVAVNKLIGVLLVDGEDESVLNSALDEEVSHTCHNNKLTAPLSSDDDGNRLEKSSACDAAAASKTLTKRVFISPYARRLAHQHNIDTRNLKGSGPKGRIISSDVQQSIAESRDVLKTSTQDEQHLVVFSGFEPSYEARPVDRTRRVIAQRLQESKQVIPHFYLSSDACIDHLMRMRQQLNIYASTKISLNDLIIRASAMALKKHPEINASWANDHIRVYQQVDIAVAVSSSSGLITPIVRQAEAKTLENLSCEMKDLIARARLQKLRLDEFQGGTFSISNMGMYGVSNFAAIINPPQAAILAVGKGRDSVTLTNDGQVKKTTIMTLTLSVDHRVIDGAAAAEFLQTLVGILETPARMIL